MKSATWELLKSMLADAMERPGTDRLAYVEQACRDRPSLYEEARSLLAEAEDADFLEPPPLCASSDEHDIDEWLGRHVGALRIERLLASGGMGHVFLGVTDSGAAALKIPAGAACPTTASRVLEHEHAILSEFDHPLIVRSLGTASIDGRPCLIMEYVDGIPIDRYCAERKLGLAARVALVIRMCAAVEHVHALGVVHGDLKPDNVLVTPRGEPRLIDFGIAQRLDQSTRASTAYAAFTPECASPEQCLNQPISPCSDVYATGVLLHRLLTGRLPHDHFSELGTWQRLQAVCRDDPLPPSQWVAMHSAQAVAGLPPPADLARQLDGDLDRIISRTLAREPRCRYPNIAELASDLAHTLGGADHHQCPSD